jgi:primosomal protein N' (replication factor Y)
VTGDLETVNNAVADIASRLSIPETDILGPTEVDGGVRTIVRFNYSLGTEVAAGLKAEIIRAATRHRRPVLDKGPRRAPQPTLRVRFDDMEPFVEN